MSEVATLIITAFGFGVAARIVKLPPLVGFLVAGFVLSAAGMSSSPWLERIADLGVTLLLFSIGLKLQVKTLLRPSVWAGASVHMALFVALSGGLFYALGFGLFGELDVATPFLIAFALSFSSTVFAVKVFEEQGRESSLHARTAIGMLIVQDLIAVVFLAASKGEPPSIWALSLLLLLPARVLLKWLMERAGHGELLLLLGFLLAFGGYALFEAVGLKGDLGALVLGMLVADHPKAKEMFGWLMGFKDLFLVGFFLSIGLGGVPSLPDLGMALFLVALIPVKTLLYFGVLTRFKLRARTATLTSLALSDYSEFGLIVAALGAKTGWLSMQWLLIIAVAVALTFTLAAPLNAFAHRIYDWARGFLLRFETSTRLPEERPVPLGDAELLIFGMGRVGTGAYEALRGELEMRVLGVDNDTAVVNEQLAAGRDVVKGDPTDIDFWERVAQEAHVRVVMLALPNHQANLDAAFEVRQSQVAPEVWLAAIAHHDDDARELEEHGVDAAFNFYSQAGQGYADLVRSTLG